MAKWKIAVIVIAALAGVVLLYVGVCSGITFIPMARAARVANTAHGESAEPSEVVELSTGAKLHYFPSTGGQDKYVVVCPGGGYTILDMQGEGYCVAHELNRLGYTAFVLEYRVGAAITSYRAPLDDLAQAVGYIDEHAAAYQVTAGRYDLVGFSAGGNLVGLFGTEHCGYACYAGVQAPATIIMGYPWINPHLSKSYRGNRAKAVLASTFLDYKGNLMDAIYYSSLTIGGATAFLGGIDNLEEMQVQRWVTPNYPRVYMMHGEDDVIVPVATAGDLFAEVLEDNGVAYRYKRCKDLGHSCGIGVGTSAEGWLEEAMAFSRGE